MREGPLRLTRTCDETEGAGRPRLDDRVSPEDRLADAGLALQDDMPRIAFDPLDELRECGELVVSADDLGPRRRHAEIVPQCRRNL